MADGHRIVSGGNRVDTLSLRRNQPRRGHAPAVMLRGRSMQQGVNPSSMDTAAQVMGQQLHSKKVTFSLPIVPELPLRQRGSPPQGSSLRAAAWILDSEEDSSSESDDPSQSSMTVTFEIARSASDRTKTLSKDNYTGRVYNHTVLDSRNAQSATQYNVPSGSDLDNRSVYSIVSALLNQLLRVDPKTYQRGYRSQRHTQQVDSVIQEIKRLAAEGHHAAVMNVLDDFMGASIPRPSRLHSSLFHTLRKICTEYGSLPDSLFLEPQTVTMVGTNAQATGGYADIYRANHSLTGLPLCVKVVRMSDRDISSGIRMKNICKEALLWKHLSHPNITPFYGMVETFDGRPGMGMICKWMPNGHIMEFLQRHRNASRPSLLLGAARGLQYLHSEEVSIVHGDIKGTNILVDERGSACLSDFGLSTVLYGTDTLNTATCVSGFRSTVRWMAPELHDPEECGLKSAAPTRESDVYSFSVTMWEVFTGEVPYLEARSDGQIIRKIMKGQRPQRPSVEVMFLGLSDAVWSVMEECWSHDRLKRPPISHVVDTLRS